MKKSSIGVIAVVLIFAAGAVTGVAWAQLQRVNAVQLPFSPARAAGDTLYVSGQIPVKEDGTVLEGSVTDQTRQTMENISAVLKDNGYTFADVANVTVYLSDMKHYQEMNAAYREFFPDNKFPARACAGGLQLAFGAHLEISAIAHKE
jgi:reactive intermediate/imine deaminase